MNEKTNETMKKLFEDDFYERSLETYSLPPEDIKPEMPKFQTAEEYYQYFKECSVRNKIESAKLSLENAISMDRDNTLYLREYVVFQYAQHKEHSFYLKDILYCLNHLLSIDNKDSIAYFYRAKMYRGNRDYDNAVKDMYSAIKLEPNNISYYLFLAQIYYSNEQYENAIKVYNKAIELDKYNPDLYLKRGQTYFANGNAAEAFKDANKTLFYDTHNSEAYFLKAQIQEKFDWFDWRHSMYYAMSNAKTISEKQSYLGEKCEYYQK